MPKGAILGYNADGLLTDRFDDVVGRFVVKSTDPNLVGADRWGTEEALVAKYGVEPLGEPPELRIVDAPKMTPPEDMTRERGRRGRRSGEAEEVLRGQGRRAGGLRRLPRRDRGGAGRI